MHQQAALDEPGRFFAHIDRCNFAGLGEGSPIVVCVAFRVMPCDQTYCRIPTTLCQALSNVGDGCRGGGDSGDDPIRNISSFQRFDLFVQAAKDRWIARFQADHMMTLLRMVYDHCINVFLLHRRAKTSFASINDNRLPAGKFEDFTCHKAVVNNDIGLIKRVAGFECQKLWIAWARANKVDMPGSVSGRNMGIEECFKCGQDTGFAFAFHHLRARFEVEGRPEIAALAAHG